MAARSLCVALALAALAAGTESHAQSAGSVDLYREAVDGYVKTGDAVSAVTLLAGWDVKQLELAVKETVASADDRRIESAALLHLEVGTALAGISFATTWVYLDLGSRLIDGLIPPNPDVVRNLSDSRKAEIAAIRGEWNGVAASVLLSINELERARTFVNKALRIAPKSAPLLALRGAVDELDAEYNDPDDVETVREKTRTSLNRAALLSRAEGWYGDALEVDPAYALAQIRLGRVFFLARNFRQAREWLTKGSAAAKRPIDRYLSAMFTGALQQSQKDYDGARQSFSDALAIAPRSQNAHVALAHLELMSGRPDRAQALTRSFLQTPDSSEGWWAFKNGTLDLEGLARLRSRVRK